MLMETMLSPFPFLLALSLRSFLPLPLPLAISRNITYLVAVYRFCHLIRVVHPATSLLSKYLEENITMHCFGYPF